MRQLLPILFVSVLSCGGKVATDFSDASDDAATTDAATDDAGNDHCVQLLQALEPLREAARTCCSNCNSIQCDVSAEDICCPISVTGKRLATATFIQAVQSFKRECNPQCPASPCPLVPSGNCSPQAMVCSP